MAYMGYKFLGLSLNLFKGIGGNKFGEHRNGKGSNAKKK
jgi:hypothetical protein